MRRSNLALAPYLAIVTLVGTLVLAVLVPHLDDMAVGVPLVAVLVACTCVGELVPIRVRRDGEQEEITTSTTFAFALLVLAGMPAAVVAHASTSLLADLFARKQLWKAGFNAAQVAVSTATAGVVLARLSEQRGGIDGTAQEAVSLVAAGIAYFVVNNVLAGVPLALATGQRVLAFLRRDLVFQAAAAAALLAMAPLVVTAAAGHALLVPLFLIPIATVNLAARSTLRLEHEATHDALTGLPNRVLLMQRTEAALAGRRPGEVGPAVLLVDLNRFKEVNDTLGHHIGDELLREVGRRLLAAFGAGATVARFGGDEFVILLPRLPRGSVEGVAELVELALAESVCISDLRLDVGGSTGIAFAPDHGEDVDTLLQRADVAMYLAKELKVPHRVYDASRDHYSPERLALHGELRQALRTGEIQVHYQPKVELATGQVTGVEALARWLHPQRGFVGPDTFVPLAEATGLAGELTYVVLDAALAQCARWRAAGQDLQVAVNICVPNLHDPTFAEAVAGLLRRWDVAARYVQFEITESTVMSDPGHALSVLHQLERLGIELAIDDFGTGYSSLAYLKRLPVRWLKIDRSFVQHMATDGDDAAIVRSTIDLARSLGLRTVAEGVEDGEALAMLKGMGCEAAQGYFLSKPVDAPTLDRWMTRYARDLALIRST